MYEEITEEILHSKKYAFLCRETVLRICRAEAVKYKRRKDAEKGIRAKLHEIYGAYFPDGCHRQAETLLKEWEGQGAPPDRDPARSLLETHLSARERIPSLDALYRYIFSLLPPVGSILDLGCGFHPFAVSWMPLSQGTTYWACDLDSRTAAVLSRYFRLRGIQGDAFCLDAAGDYQSGLPAGRVDLAYLMKLLPVLEQQEKGLGLRVLAEAPAKYLAVTFPAKSLGGREKGMEAHYSAYLESGLPGHLKILGRERIGSELVYVLADSRERTAD